MCFTLTYAPAQENAQPSNSGQTNVPSLTHDIGRLLARYQLLAKAGQDADELSTIKTQLRQMVAEMFDWRNRRQQAALVKLEGELRRLRTHIQARDQSRESLIDQRLEDLLSGKAVVYTPKHDDLHSELQPVHPIEPALAPTSPDTYTANYLSALELLQQTQNKMNPYGPSAPARKPLEREATLARHRLQSIRAGLAGQLARQKLALDLARTNKQLADADYADAMQANRKVDNAVSKWELARRLANRKKQSLHVQDSELVLQMYEDALRQIDAWDEDPPFVATTSRNTDSDIVGSTDGVVDNLDRSDRPTNDGSTTAPISSSAIDEPLQRPLDYVEKIHGILQQIDRFKGSLQTKKASKAQSNLNSARLLLKTTLQEFELQRKRVEVQVDRRQSARSNAQQVYDLLKRRYEQGYATLQEAVVAHARVEDHAAQVRDAELLRKAYDGAQQLIQERVKQSEPFRPETSN